VTERAKDIRAAIIGALIGTAVCVLYVAGAFAHSWYDWQCCSDQDCYPVPVQDVIETDKGWKHLPTGTEFTKEQVKPSKDHRFHVCIGNKAHDMGRPYCIYILQGA
jgi:hypothetical protein